MNCHLPHKRKVSDKSVAQSQTTPPSSPGEGDWGGEAVGLSSATQPLTTPPSPSGEGGKGGRGFFFFLLLFIPLLSPAQNTYTEKLRKSEAGKGVVIINQADEIERIVNNTAPKAATPASNTKPSSSSSSSDKADKKDAHKEGHEGKEAENNHNADKAKDKTSYAPRTRHKARGYRICIYTGGNSRADQLKAKEMAQKCRAKFSELGVYPSFIAPRWVTHVGDFRTRQDAQKYTQRIRRAGFTNEVRIVPSEVNLYD